MHENSSLSFPVSKHFIFVDSEILVTGQESGACLVWWTIVSAQLTAAVAVCVGSIADVQVTIAVVAVNPVPFLISFKRHLGWTNTSTVHQAEQERLGTCLVSVYSTLGNGKREACMLEI